jgi:hypothetical protein
MWSLKRLRQRDMETTDYVATPEITENRIVPDAAFVMENIETKRRGLFFVEMDMATERIVSYITRDSRITLSYKLAQYDRYLHNVRCAERSGAKGAEKLGLWPRSQEVRG